MLPVGQANRASSERASWIYVYWLSWIVGSWVSYVILCFVYLKYFVMEGKKEGKEGRER